jgi:hypothetical protein
MKFPTVGLSVWNAGPYRRNKTCTALAPPDPKTMGNTYKCFGTACRLISASWPLGDFR